MNQNEQDDKEFLDYLRKRTEGYSKKILFHQIFFLFYVVLFFHFLNLEDFFIPKYITLPISGLMTILHILLFRKNLWFFNTFGYHGEEYDDF
jgi:hypothetical protein